MAAVLKVQVFSGSRVKCAHGLCLCLSLRAAGVPLRHSRSGVGRLKPNHDAASPSKPKPQTTGEITYTQARQKNVHLRG